MNNNLVTIRMTTFKALDEFLNELNVVTGMNTEYAREFGKAGRKIGDVLQVRKPQRWIVKTGASYQEQPISDTYTTVVVDRHRHIGYDYGAFESVLSLDDMYNRYFRTSVNQLANQVDDEASEFMYLNTNNYVGTLGTNPASLADSQSLFLTAFALLMENGCPTGNLSAVFHPRMAAAVMQYLNTNYNPQTELGEQFKRGELMKRMFGFARTAVDQNIRSHTSGTQAGTASWLVNGAAVDGDTQIVTDGLTAGDTVKAGDIIQVGSQNNVNPKNRRSTNIKKNLVALADATADSGGNMTILLGGGMSLAGPGNQYQNVDVLAADNATVFLWGAHATTYSNTTGYQSLAFAEDAFAFVPITLPDVGEEGAFCSQATDAKTGISLTNIRQFNAETYRRIARLDIGFGFGNLYPDNESVRMVGA